MKISILTMFPEIFDSYFSSPIPRRAMDRKAAEISVVDIKQYAGGSFRHIDDDTYGGGAGAVLRAKPILEALKSVLTSCPTSTTSDSSLSNTKSTRIVALTPVGHLYSQHAAVQYCKLDHLVLICGHYEGMDERIYSHVDDRISIGDYILSGGELAAEVVIDSILRLLPGVLRAASTLEESFSGSSASGGLLEYPQFTRPADLDGDHVPEVLLSGDHEAIRLWRLKESLRATLRWRPGLLSGRVLSAEEQQLLNEIREETDF